MVILMYRLEVKDSVDKIFQKLSERNPKQLEIVRKKIHEIMGRPFGYKHLRKPLEGFDRVHVDSNFVLIFHFDHVNKLLIIDHFDHHDYVYKWRPEIER